MTTFNFFSLHHRRYQQILTAVEKMPRRTCADADALSAAIDELDAIRKSICIIPPRGVADCAVKLDIVLGRATEAVMLSDHELTALIQVRSFLREHPPVDPMAIANQLYKIADALERVAGVAATLDALGQSEEIPARPIEYLGFILHDHHKMARDAVEAVWSTKAIGERAAQ